MRKYKVNRSYHKVYAAIDEVPSDIQVIEDWRNGEVGDWAKTDDDCVVQILRKGVLNSQYSKGKKTKYFGTCTGTYTETMNMTSVRNEDIYTLGGKSRHSSFNVLVLNCSSFSFNSSRFLYPTIS